MFKKLKTKVVIENPLEITTFEIQPPLWCLGWWCWSDSCPTWSNDRGRPKNEYWRFLLAYIARRGSLSGSTRKWKGRNFWGRFMNFSLSPQ
ncbi:hypothetical protein TNCT_533981 [Trichonephila clavata]|uniref:Uncharacterized protein n=1 Tax=Trichonephila clavata TaxID=2740835 RepID=A0A8X6ITQ6_TRICU|nr:hypothetical protein TNCT_533981 [Trichonephila clavata]